MVICVKWREREGEGEWEGEGEERGHSILAYPIYSPWLTKSEHTGSGSHLVPPYAWGSWSGLIY